jgi:hypothetical protein
MKSTPRRKLAAACIILAGFALVAVLFTLQVGNRQAANRDFIQYWAAGQQLVHGGDPYDPAAAFRLERSVGLEDDFPRLSISPPVIACLEWPLGFVDPKTGLIAWLLIQIACASLSIWMLWMLHGSPPTRLHLLGYGFAPILACMMAGQLGIFFLLAITLLLYFYRSRPFLAGAALLPCAMKPHLFVPFGLVLLLWMALRRQFRILAGCAAACAASCALASYLDPRIWSQYTRMMGSTAMFDVFIPTLSTVLRFAVDRHAVWLQFVPEALACVWAIGYLWVRRPVWDWRHHGLLVLLVSVACAPYAWFTDEAVLLPAVLAGLYAATELRRSLLPLALFGGVALIEVLRAVPLTSPYYLWTPLAWLAWYLYATRSGVSGPGMREILCTETVEGAPN